MLKDIFTRQLTINWLARIFFFTALAALLPMSQFIEDIGGNKSQIGVVMSTFAIGVLLFRPLVGKAVDNLGRKTVLIFGAAIFIIAPLLYTLVNSVNTLIPIRIFHGLGLAAFGTASITLITDAAPKDQRNQVISYTGMVNTIAFASGPALGFFVYTKWGYDTLFSLVSFLSLFSLLLSLLVKETKIKNPDAKKVNYFHVINQRRILVAAAIILIVGLVHGGVMFYIPLFLKNVDINKGLFYTTYGVAAFLVRAVVGSLTVKLGRGPFLALSIFLLSIGVFLLSQTTGATLMLISAIFYGVGFGSHQPTLTTLVADNTTEETRGKIFSFYYGGFDLGISLAGFMLGAIAENYGIKNMFIVCGFMTLGALLIFITLMENKLTLSLKCALSIGGKGGECYICDQFQEVAPKQAEVFFEKKQ